MTFNPFRIGSNILSFRFHSSNHVGQPTWHQSAGPRFFWVVHCEKLIPQWSQDCLEACCVWSLSGHFNISPRPWVSPHVAPAITGGSPLSFFLPPSAALPQSTAVVYQLLVLLKFFVFRFLFYFTTTFLSNVKHNRYWACDIIFRTKSNLLLLQTLRLESWVTVTVAPRVHQKPFQPSLCLLYHWSASKPNSYLCVCVPRTSHEHACI